MSTPHHQNTPLQVKATVVYADGRRVTQRWMVSADSDGPLSFNIFARKKDSETDELFRAYFTLDETAREDPASSEYVVLTRDVHQEDCVWEPLHHPPSESPTL